MENTDKIRAKLVVEAVEGKLNIKVVQGVNTIHKLLPERIGEQLDPIEALYLVYTNAAEAYNVDGRKLEFEELVRMYTAINPYAWVELEVYIDLRRRGRIPVPGPRQHTFLLRKSKKARQYTHYVLVLEENRPIKISEIYNFVEEALKNGWEPILAIVDRYGDITYYKASIFRPSKQPQTRVV